MTESNFMNCLMQHLVNVLCSDQCCYTYAIHGEMVTVHSICHIYNRVSENSILYNARTSNSIQAMFAVSTIAAIVTVTVVEYRASFLSTDVYSIKISMALQQLHIDLGQLQLH